VDITHSFGYDLRPCYIEVLKQVVQHDSIDHIHLIQYDYKSSCKHSWFKKNPTNECCHS
jgi:hypothetical protein